MRSGRRAVVFGVLGQFLAVATGTALAGGAPPNGAPARAVDEVDAFLAGTRLVSTAAAPGYRLETRTSTRASHEVRIAPDLGDAFAQHLMRDGAVLGVSRAAVVVLASVDEVPDFVRPLYPQFAQWGGLTRVEVNLQPIGFPGWRTIAWFIYHRAGERLLAYYVPDDLPPDEAATERVMSDIVTGAVLEMHERDGMLLNTSGVSQDPTAARALRTSKSLVFTRR